MKKVLAAAISVILALALPAFVLAADVNNGQENGKDVKIKEVSMEVTGLPDEINEGDEVVLTFIVPRSGSKWEYGDMSGLLEPETYFDEETCSYVTMAMIDTASAGPLEIIFEFIMTAGKSHVRFSALYENTMEISGIPVKSNIIYYWNQDFTDNYDGWNTGGSAGSITLDSGAALFEMGYDGQGPYSFFEGSNADWTGDWYSSIKVFLDPGSFTEGLGFDYITAINEGDSTFLDSYGFSFISGTSSINASSSAFAVEGISITSPNKS